MNPSTYRVGFFVSGRGSNFRAVVDHMRDGSLAATPAFVLSNNSTSEALAFARTSGIPSYHVSSRTEPDIGSLAERMVGILRDHATDLLVLAGYMKIVAPEVLKVMQGAVVNIHPALLPAFGGMGWYGIRVHEGVIRRGCWYSGVTIHAVTAGYDEGPILLQRVLQVRPDDTPGSLAARVLEVEHAWLWRVVRAFAQGTLKPHAGGVEGVEAFRSAVQGEGA